MGYVTLPSNASVLMYPENTQSHFVVHLPSPLEFVGKWEVGLAEIHIPYSWNNITNETNQFEIIEIVRTVAHREFYVTLPAARIYGSYTLLVKRLNENIPERLRDKINFSIKMNHGVITIILNVAEGYAVKLGRFGEHLNATDPDRWITGRHTEFIVQRRKLELDEVSNKIKIRELHPVRNEKVSLIDIPRGQYKSISTLADAINEAIGKTLKTEPGFYAHFRANANGRIAIVTNGELYVRFNKPGLREMLGFKEDKRYFGLAEGEYLPDITAGVHGLYVYTDLILPQVVGDVFAPLLRVIPASRGSAQNNTIVHTFDRPDYYPLARKAFSSIEIDVRSDFGTRIEFTSGKTLVKLHFREMKD